MFEQTFKNIDEMFLKLEKEFGAIMRFDSTYAIIEFSEPDNEEGVIPEAAQKLLSRSYKTSQHDLVFAEDFPNSR
jgi:hypothetical protein